MSAISPTLEHLLRELAPQVLGAVIRRHRNFSACEDVVQEALIAAATQWPTQGIPDNPRGWLIQVATRRMADHVRAEMARRHRESIVVGLVPPEMQLVLPPDSDDLAALDDTLALLFRCCHPALTPSSAIALTLRAVGGLTTAEIARAFLVPEATMAQRISRAKQTLAGSSLSFDVPERRERMPRLESVLHVLYLMFNEGYVASSGTEVQRTDLAHEAIRLTRLLCALVPEHDETSGLLALMLLTDARRLARTGAHGEIVPLHEQDRALWDQAAIAEGVALISATLPRGHVGEYQLQAAISAVHDEAARAEDTDWPQILALYVILRQLSDNPMVLLNRAVAAAMVHGPSTGLELLTALDADPRLAHSHRLDAVRAHLLERAGEREQAMVHYRAAAERTTSTAERTYLLTQAARLREP